MKILVKILAIAALTAVFVGLPFVDMLSSSGGDVGVALIATLITLVGAALIVAIVWWATSILCD